MTWRLLSSLLRALRVPLIPPIPRLERTEPLFPLMRWRLGRGLTSLLAAALLTACAQWPAVRSDENAARVALAPAAAWTPVAPDASLLYERDTHRPGEVLHWLRLDLQDPQLRLALTRPSERGRPLDRFDGASTALAAFNASFFTPAFEPRGLTVSEGEVWSPVVYPQGSPLIACDDQSRCRLQLQSPYALPGKTWLAVAGTPWLVRGGVARQPADDDTCPSFCAMTHPRTALGLDVTGRFLTVVLAEGRRGDVAGLSLSALADRLVSRGVYEAFNLDGGGSSSLLLLGKSVMARPFSEPALRSLANALLIQRVTSSAQPQAQTPTPTPTSTSTPVQSVRSLPAVPALPALLHRTADVSLLP